MISHKFQKIQALALTAIILSGCGMLPETEYIDRVQYIERTVVHPEMPSQTEFLDVEFEIISRTDFIARITELSQELGLSVVQEQQLIESLTEQAFGDADAWFALDDQNYSNISENMQEIIRYIRQQQNIILYYRETYPSSNDETGTNTQN